MKKRILSLALCLLLLGGTALAAGGADDPLISLDYIQGIFLPQVRTALASRAGQLLTARDNRAAAQGLRTLRLGAGQALSLGAGQQFILLSGGGTLRAETGAVVDTAAGAEAPNDAVRLYTRYLICEDSAGVLELTEDSLVRCSPGAAAMQPETSVITPAPADDVFPFLDVPSDSWYYSDVESAYRRGLVNGMTADSFVPGATLTGGQCVKLAACMHQLWFSNAVTLTNSTEGPWYRSYVDYALLNGILSGELADYDSPLTRREFVRIFYRALPESFYPGINHIPDGAIPDVAAADPDGAFIYRFYRAGILTGYTNTEGFADHAFGPETTITRAEVATIMNRMFDAGARKNLNIQ